MILRAQLDRDAKKKVQVLPGSHLKTDRNYPKQGGISSEISIWDSGEDESYSDAAQHAARKTSTEVRLPYHARTIKPDPVYDIPITHQIPITQPSRQAPSSYNVEPALSSQYSSNPYPQTAAFQSTYEAKGQNPVYHASHHEESMDNLNYGQPLVKGPHFGSSDGINSPPGPSQRSCYKTTGDRPSLRYSNSSDAAQPTQVQNAPAGISLTGQQFAETDRALSRSDIPRSHSAPTLGTSQGFRVYKPGVVSDGEASSSECIAMLDSCGYGPNQISERFLTDMGIAIPRRSVIELRIVATGDGPVEKGLEFYVKFEVWDRPGAVLLLSRKWIEERWNDGTFYTHPGSRKKGQ